MRTVVMGILLLGLGLAGCRSQTGGATMMEINPHIGHVRHVVLFKFKPQTSPDMIKTIEQAFSALPGRIDEILAYEWGVNISPEGHDMGYTHCFLLTFRNEADRDAYLVHPAHKEFVNLVGPHLEPPHVIDYIARQ